MKIVVLILGIVFSALSFASQPSDESLRDLMELSQSKQLFEKAMADVDAMMLNSMQQALGAHGNNKQNQDIMNSMHTKMSAMFKEELSWKVLEPMFLKIYRESLTQYEVDGMVDFYKSDAGKALALKMPLIMQKTMQSMQERMMVIMPKIQKAQQEMIQELKSNKSQ